MKVISKKVIEITTADGNKSHEGKVVIEKMFLGIFPYRKNYWLMCESGGFPYLSPSRLYSYYAGAWGWRDIYVHQYKNINDCKTDLEKALINFEREYLSEKITNVRECITQ